ncbi:MAG: hypothetical protein HRT90_00370 [Candidatus Margulisbacteria bacterium]|nr:hypothetical protein [Candidatus Margulisiibacteriota bacterium]
MKRIIFAIICIIIGITVTFWVFKSTDRPENGSEPRYFGLNLLEVTDNMKAFNAFKSSLKKTPHLSIFKVDWNQPFPMAQGQLFLKWGSIVQISWQPWQQAEIDVVLPAHILEGDMDEYIDRWAEHVKFFQYPVFIQFAPYINSPDYPWGFMKGHWDVEEYKEIFQYVVNRFRDIGAENAIWVWSIYVPRDSNELSLIAQSYPGDDYVDWIGIGQYSLERKPVLSEIENVVMMLSLEYSTKPLMLTSFRLPKSSSWLKDLNLFSDALEGGLKPVKLWSMTFLETDTWMMEEPYKTNLMIFVENFEGKLDDLQTLSVNKDAPQ